jgi:hypothetical protein
MRCFIESFSIKIFDLRMLLRSFLLICDGILLLKKEKREKEEDGRFFFFAAAGMLSILMLFAYYDI